MATEKKLKTVDVEVSEKKDKSTYKDVIYIRNVPKSAQRKFSKYAEDLNMKRSELFQLMLSKVIVKE